MLELKGAMKGLQLQRIMKQAGAERKCFKKTVGRVQVKLRGDWLAAVERGLLT